MKYHLHKIFFRTHNGRFIESTSSECIGYVEYEVAESWIDYRASNKVILNNLNIEQRGWSFNKEVLIEESTNYHDVEQVKFKIRSVSPQGKCEETEFTGRYIFHPENESNSAVLSIITAVTLIVMTDSTNAAKELYEYCLTYPFLPYNANALPFTYSSALQNLLRGGIHISRIKTDSVFGKEFYNYVVETYNSFLRDFTDSLCKYRASAQKYPID